MFGADIAAGFVQGIGIAALTALAMEQSLRLCPTQRCEGLATAAILSLGLAASMALPIEFMPGVIFDLRHVFLVIAASFGGVPASIATVAAAVLLRVYQGGLGMVAGIVGILITGGLGLGIALLRGNRPFTFRALGLAGLLSSVSILSVFVLPLEIALNFLTKVSPYMILANLAGTVIIGAMLTGRRSRFYRERALRRDTQTDPLTGLANRRLLDSIGPKAAERAIAQHGCFAFLVVDIDNFKAVNDTFGHQSGDAVLRHVASVIRTHVSDGDITARFGGEEIVVLVANGAYAATVAEQMRKSVAATSVIVNGFAIKVTVSIGYAIERESEHELEDVFERADAALYEAKRAGRNRVEHARAA